MVEVIGITTIPVKVLVPMVADGVVQAEEAFPIVEVVVFVVSY